MLDLGSGAGADVLISARRVGPTGKAIGLDMTDEMLALARQTRSRPARRTSSSSRATSRRYRSPTTSVDVVISNCVHQPLRRQAARAQGGRARTAGRAGASPSATSSPIPGWTRPRAGTWRSGPDASPGRSRARSSKQALTDAGLTDIEIGETHRVHEQAASAIIRASKPRRVHERHARGPPARPADALPALGGEPVEPVRDRPGGRPRAVAGDGRPQRSCHSCSAR